MKKHFLIAFLSFLPVNLHAVCVSSGANAWHCPTTGDAWADGSDFYNFLKPGSLYGQAYACGDTITLDGGAMYRPPAAGIYRLNFVFPPQTGCAAGQYTTVVSSSFASLPTTRLPNLSDLSNMAQLVASTGTNVQPAAVLSPYSYTASGLPSANNFRFKGLAFYTDPLLSATTGVAALNNMVTIAPPFDGATSVAQGPHNVDIDRCLFFPGEEKLYGSAFDVPSATTTEATYVRSIHSGIAVIGTSITLTNSSFYGFIGFDPLYAPNRVNISSVTAGTTTIVYAVGISTTFGMPSTLNTTWCLKNGVPTCTIGCTSNAIPAGCQVVLFNGASGAWGDLNGYKYVVAIDTDHVAVGWADYRAPWIPHYYDSSGRSQTGIPATARKTYGLKIDPQYDFTAGGADQLTVDNNYFEAADMTIFSGGGSFMTSSGTIAAAGSSSTTIVFSVATGTPPVVDQILSVDVPSGSPDSPWCVTACGANQQVRTGRVGSISNVGPVYTAQVTPVGPEGINVAPSTGTRLAWDGLQQGNNWIFTHNEIRKPPRMYPTGKGDMEIKSCHNCYIDGNNYTGSYGGPFTEAVNQTLAGGTQDPGAPWAGLTNTHISNNIMWQGFFREVLNGRDFEETSALNQTNVVWEHNLNINSNIITDASDHFYESLGNITEGGYRHNTDLADPLSVYPAWAYIYYRFSCPTPWTYPDNYGYIYTYTKDNIASYGVGTSSYGYCYPNQVSSTTANVFISDLGVSTTTINSGWPNNFPVANLAAVGFESTCSSSTVPAFKGCKLATSSPWRGLATDGGDPGADLLQVYDHVNGWSTRAGLTTVDPSRDPMWFIDPNHWTVASTTARPTFLIQTDISSCTAHLYTTPNRSTEHADTISASACNRSGNTVSGSSVTYVFGNNTPLSSGTTYYYAITDGSDSNPSISDFGTLLRTMVGSFTTSGSTPAPTPSSVISGAAIIKGTATLK